MKDQPRVPTIIAIIILLIGLVSTIVLIDNSTKLFSRASVDTAPTNVTLAGITDTAFAVGWLTNDAQTGMIQYKEKGVLGTYHLAFDVRDNDQKMQPRYTHFMNITGLKPKTTYDVKVLSGQKLSDQTMTITTFAQLPAPATSKVPAYGKVIDSSNKPASDTLVFVSASDSQTLGAITSADGSFLLPTNLLRTADGNSYYLLKNNDTEKFVFLGNNGKSQLLTLPQNDAPLPTVRLGENYDFTKKSFRFIPQVFAETYAFNLFEPQNNSAIPATKPLFKGVGIPNKNVLVVISGPLIISENIQVGINGTWSYVPKKELLPGKYTGTFTSYNDVNQAVTKSLSFIILKSGTQVLGDATPSATRQPSPIPSSTPKPTPKATPKLSTPSATPKVATVSTPTTGTWEPTLVMLILGSGILFAGLFGFKKSKI